MKKSTLILVIAALVLGLVAFLTTRGGDKPAPKRLDLAGYATPEQLERDKRRGLLDPVEPIPHPIDEIILERAEGRVRLVRQGAGEDAVWRLTEPVEAVAVKWHVDSITDVFRSPTTRSDTRNLKPADFPLFDFEPSRRIGLTLKSAGAVWGGVDLVIGQVVKERGPEGDVVKGTWVMVRGDESTAFLLTDKDLRSPADKTLAELRDKRVFAFEGDDISKIEIIPPTGDAARVVLSATTTETPAAPDAPAGTAPTRTSTWTIAEPPGHKADLSVASFARTLASLRAEDFIALAAADTAATDAFSRPAWRFLITVGEATHTLTLTERPTAATGDKDRVWGRLEGHDEVLALSGWAAQNLKKGLEELKDKTVWELSTDTIDRLSLATAEGGAVTLRRGPEGWRFEAPAVKFESDPSQLLPSLTKLSAARWARPDEVEAARASLASPAIKASISANTTWEVTFSAPLEGDDAQQRWGQVLTAGAPSAPFLVSDFTARRFITSADALRQKKLVPDLKDQLSAITITLAGTKDTVRLERRDTGFQLLGMLPGETQDDDAIRALTSTIGALEAKSFHDGRAATETGLTADKAHTIGLELADGRRLTLLVSQVGPAETERYVLASDGPQKGVPVGVNEFQLKHLTRARAELVKAP